jgi:hypothetical protein
MAPEALEEQFYMASFCFAEPPGNPSISQEQATQVTAAPWVAKDSRGHPNRKRAQKSATKGKNGGDPRQLVRARSFKAHHWPRECQKMTQECQERRLEESPRLVGYLAALSQHGAKDRGQKEALTRFFFVQDFDKNIETVLCKNTQKMVEFRIIRSEPFLSGLVGLFGMELEGVVGYSQSRRTLNKAIKDWGFEPNAREENQKFRPKWKEAYLGQISFVAV